MTVDRSNPRAKPRWLALGALVLGLTAILGAGAASAVTPAGFTATVDEQGANDVPAQSDVTQMGVKASESPTALRIFWSWDSISAWTGSGQTGDACALFDTNDTDLFINYVVCARVQNTAAPNTVVLLPAALNKPVYIFSCTNKKFDRCSQPTPLTYTAGQVLAGPLSDSAGTALSQTGAGNLVSATDPFDSSALNGPGESYPYDSSIDLRIFPAALPAGVTMVNVCSYPSAGNGGNNNPFDCIKTPGAGQLIVNKTLINDNGGTALVTSFNFTVGSGTATTGVVTSTAFEADASNSVALTEGTYSVAEVGTPIAGYTTSYSNCTSVSVVAGGTATCTITNNDNAPSLTLVKSVLNNNGGTALPAAWTLTATGYDSASPDAGTYNLSESGGPAGYTQTSLTCSDTGATQVTSVTLSLGESVTCTFVNSDNAPSLTLVKSVLNNNGGTAVATDWTLSAGTYSAASPQTGTYNLSESGGPAGYTQTSLTCSDTGATQVTSVTLSLGESVTCTFVNSDNAPSLTLVKTVINDSGGTAVSTDWTLTATGYDSASPDAGTYNLSESGPGGYTQTSLTCTDTGTTQVTSVTLSLGENVTCTFVNDDNPASPGIGTTMSWRLYDSAALSGFRPGGGVSTVTFTLYLGTSCAGTGVGGVIVTVDDTDGTASTTDGFLVTEPGTYSWIASFSGNTFNDAIDSPCGDEVTTITE